MLDSRYVDTLTIANTQLVQLTQQFVFMSWFNDMCGSMSGGFVNNFAEKRHEVFPFIIDMNLTRRQTSEMQALFFLLTTQPSLTNHLFPLRGIQKGRLGPFGLLFESASGDWTWHLCVLGRGSNMVTYVQCLEWSESGAKQLV